jgi:hypothetical protein
MIKDIKSPTYRIMNPITQLSFIKDIIINGMTDLNIR